MGLFDNLVSRASAAGVNKTTGAPRQPQAPTNITPPPSPAVSAPVGRPPTPSPAAGAFPGGVGTPLPLAGSAPTPPPAPAPQGPPPTPGGKKVGIPTGEQGGIPTPPPATPTPAPAGGASTAPVPQGQASMTGATPGGFSMTLDHVPSGGELATLPPGVAITTPFGSIDRTTGALVLSPEGKQAYQEALVRQRTRFGPHPFANDPTAAPIPVDLGKPLFNPFTGRWVDRPGGWGGRR